MGITGRRKAYLSIVDLIRQTMDFLSYRRNSRSTQRKKGMREGGRELKAGRQDIKPSLCVFVGVVG